MQPFEANFRDPHWMSLWQDHGDIDRMVKAGWIDDGLRLKQWIELDRLARLWIPDLSALLEGDTVLITTGGFSPLHRGHLSMMEQAKKCVEDRGMKVAGGFFSPSHDAYVSKKSSPGSAYKATERLHAMHQILHKHQWLRSDSWESLAAGTDVNWTDVVRILHQRLLYWTGRDYRMVYVCGSDNATFAEAYREHGYMVCIGRAGHLPCPETERVFVVEHHDYADMSSSKLLTQARAQFRKEHAWYAIRDDLSWACKAWPFTPTLDAEFVQALASAANMPVGLLSLADQQQWATQNCHNATLSIDNRLDMPLSWAVSRMFCLGSSMHTPQRMIFAALPDAVPQCITLLDDDIASGYTIRACREILAQQNIEVCNSVSVLDKAPRPYSTDPWDVVDARDFLLATRDGGLLCQDGDNNNMRVLYSLPAMILQQRMKLEPQAVMAFSKAVWQYNIRVHSQSRMTVKDCPELQRAWLFGCGYNLSTSLLQIAKDMLQALV